MSPVYTPMGEVWELDISPALFFIRSNTFALPIMMATAVRGVWENEPNSPLGLMPQGVAGNF
jgi:hypothetical protein